mgnify:CR=1 FL=1
MAIPPVIAPGLGPEAQIGGVGGLGADAQIGVQAPADPGFGTQLLNQVQNLNNVQGQADQLQQAMAAGENVDVTQVVVAAERAQMSMQLATQMRNQLVSAYNELMRTQM